MATGVLSAAEVLPGFELPLGQLFAKLDHTAENQGEV
jgi:hypothetical protein